MDKKVARTDAVLCSLLLSWWLACVATLFRPPGGRAFLSITLVVLLFIPFLRLIHYVRGYAPPLSLWGRLRLFRPIIPGYDQVFIGPICSFLAGPMTLSLMLALRVPFEVGASIAGGMIVLVALLTPPSLRRWRLTGAHRMTPTVGQGQGKDGAESQYVKVG